MKIKKLVKALSAIGFGLALAGPAAAAVTFFSPFTVLHDDDLDFVVDNQLTGPGAGILSTGDRLISVIEFQDSRGILSGQGPSAFQPGFELTAVADITIATTLVVGGVTTFFFAPSGAAGVLSGFAAGTTVALWTDSTPDLDVANSNCGTRAQCLGLAGLGGTDGSALWATIGFFGDPDSLWVSSPSPTGATISAVQGGSASQTFGTFNFSQSVGINNTGTALGLQPCGAFCGPGGDGLVQVVGNGQILGGQGLIPLQWTARSKADAQLAPIPEPGSLVLLGAALAAAGAMRRRKQN